MFLTVVCRWCWNSGTLRASLFTDNKSLVFPRHLPRFTSLLYLSAAVTHHPPCTTGLSVCVRVSVSTSSPGGNSDLRSETLSYDNLLIAAGSTVIEGCWFGRRLWVTQLWVLFVGQEENAHSLSSTVETRRRMKSNSGVCVRFIPQHWVTRQWQRWVSNCGVGGSITGPGNNCHALVTL